MELGHSIPWAGHMASQKTLNRIGSRFVWPGMYTQVSQFCASCEICQLTSAKGVTRAQLQSLPIIDTPFERIGMDIVGPLEKSSSGHRYILVICDYATRYPEAFPLRSFKARQVADCLLQLFSRVGIPKEILTDCGTNFLSKLLQQVYQLLGVKGIKTTPYHPQTDGLVERYNRTLKNMLRKFVSHTGSDWNRWLPYLLFAYREVPQASTGFSPFELLYGRQVRGPLDLLRDYWERSKPEGENVVAYVVKMRERLEEMTALAHEHMESAQRNQKVWYDRKARERVFHPGQKVLLLLPTSDCKLLTKWHGPYEISKCVGKVTYELFMPDRFKKYQTFHVNLLKEFQVCPEPVRQQLLVRAVKEEDNVDKFFPATTTTAEPPEGFFRRSIQQNINYKMCVKNENCLIMRMNRNRCQHCRFKKCLSVGMSRDAVRFGRIPKREKQRLLDEMQSYMNSLNESAAMDMDSSSVSPDEGNSKEAIGAISRAYHDIFTSSSSRSQGRVAKRANVTANDNTSSFSQDASFPQASSHPISAQSYQSCPVAPATICPVAPNDNQPTFHNVDNNRYTYFVSTNPNHNQSNGTTPQSGAAAHHNSYRNAGNATNPPSCPWKLAQGAKVLACPLNACPVSGADRSSQEIWESFSQCFTPAVKEVVEFAKGIPGFQELSQQDQVMLLKSGTFQVLMVRFCTLFNAEDRTVTFLNGKTYPLSTLRALGMGTLLDAMFEFSEKLGSLGLEPDEMALFMAVVLVSADRSGILDMWAVEQLQEGLIRALRSLINRRRPDDSTLFPKLLLRLPDLRTLNNFHSEKLLAFRIDP